MQDKKYETLVWSLQAKADHQPGLFRGQVIGISILAYVVLLGIFALLGTLVWWTLTRQHIHVKAWIGIGVVLFTLIPVSFIFLRTLLRRISPPTGRILSQEEAPQLFKLLSDIRKRLDGPPIHQVLITSEFNAAISQVPRFGLFGGHRNYLILGLPFLFGMSPREMAAVVAHEYGHLAGGHGKLGAWIYRQRRTFGALQRHIDERREDDSLNGLLAGLLDHFGPYYNAYTFVLSRQQEYEADAAAARYAGSEHIATGLIRSQLLGRWLAREFWPKLYEQSTSRATPSYLPYSSMGKAIAITHTDWATDQGLQHAWKAESDVHDTHPCLRERVDALDQACRLPKPIERSAAEAMLGPQATTIAREFDRDWWMTEKKRWQENHRRHIEGNKRLAELESRPRAELDIHTLQELALLLFDFRSTAEAKPVLEYLLSRPGERYPKPLYYYGWALLEEGDAKGLDKLVEAARLSPAMLDDCARVGYRWLCRHRDEEAAEDWLEHLYPEQTDTDF